MNGVDQWVEGEVDFDQSATSVRFRGIRGGQSRSNPYGDIALDDVEV